MIYQMYDDIAPEKVERLNQLSDELNFKNSYGHRCRMGANKGAKCSLYETSKWFNWNREQRAIFKDAFPAQQVKPAIIGYFLYIPPGDGFLDKQTAWVNMTRCGQMVVIALQDQTFWIEGHEVKFKKGQSFGFHLAKIHEIKPSVEGQQWACMMVRADVTQLV